MGKIRILHVIDKLETGGGQIFLRNLFRMNQVDNVEFFLCVLRSSINEVDINFKNTFRFYRRKWNPLSFLDIYYVAKRLEIDIVHLHLTKSFFMGVISSFFGKWKVIVHSHSSALLHHPVLARFIAVFLRITRSRVNVFIAVSNSIRDELIEQAHVPPKKIKVVRTCIDLEEFRQRVDRRKVRASIGVKTHETVIGFLGRLVRIKGCEYLIEAVKILKEIEQPIVLLIAGDGVLRRKLMAMTHNLGQNRSAIFLGNVTDVPRLLAAFDIAVIPSLWEGFPLVALQFMAAKIPVIASKVGGLSELIEDRKNGLFVERGSASALAKAIDELIANENLKETLRANEFDIVKQFDVHNVFPYIRNIYLQL